MAATTAPRFRMRMAGASLVVVTADLDAGAGVVAPLPATEFIEVRDTAP